MFFLLTGVHTFTHTCLPYQRSKGCMMRIPTWKAWYAHLFCFQDIEIYPLLLCIHVFGEHIHGMSMRFCTWMEEMCMYRVYTHQDLKVWRQPDLQHMCVASILGIETGKFPETWKQDSRFKCIYTADCMISCTMRTVTYANTHVHISGPSWLGATWCKQPPCVTFTPSTNMLFDSRHRRTWAHACHTHLPAPPGWRGWFYVCMHAFECVCVCVCVWFCISAYSSASGITRLVFVVGAWTYVSACTFYVYLVAVRAWRSRVVRMTNVKKCTPAFCCKHGSVGLLHYSFLQSIHTVSSYLSNRITIFCNARIIYIHTYIQCRTRKFSMRRPKL